MSQIQVKKKTYNDFKALGRAWNLKNDELLTGLLAPHQLIIEHQKELEKTK